MTFQASSLNMTVNCVNYMVPNYSYLEKNITTGVTIKVPEIDEHGCILNCMKGSKGTTRPTVPIVTARTFSRSKVSKFNCVPKV